MEYVVVNSRCLRVGEQLGEGGYAFVHRVTDESTGEQFALKRIHIQNRTIKQQIASEVKYWKLLSGHSNVVSFVDVAEDKQTNKVLILSELCTGGSLFDLINKFNGKLSEAQIVHIMIDLCKGLSHLHSKGIAHRDIKVENVLVHNKQFKLCDFGSASKQVLDHNDPKLTSAALEEEIERFEALTTMMYRPPEMIDHYLKYRVDTQADIWMLGCVLFSMCFGFHPF